MYFTDEGIKERGGDMTWLAQLKSRILVYNHYIVLSIRKAIPPSIIKKEVRGISLHHACCLTLNTVCVNVLSHVRLFVTPQIWTHQDPLSVGFSSKNTGVGCHFLLQRIFLTQGSAVSPVSPALTGRFFTTRETWEALTLNIKNIQYSFQSSRHLNVKAILKSLVPKQREGWVERWLDAARLADYTGRWTNW